MSIVIIGGHERMESKYKKLCKSYGYKAKVFTKMTPNLERQIGNPDYIILFTSTVSHKMVNSTMKQANKINCDITRCSSSSANALEEALKCFYCDKKDKCMVRKGYKSGIKI
ncbi:MAG: DUF2325 domain-containing protein [Clostridiales bacterium]|nr:MAG: DUF2325 domain-containing protein [Clostridiales bacterium]